ncbi:MAG: class I SAM-dependent methyltransferase [Nitrospirae bacterium]|nr:class I SAM-dependent methyltransferase [Nitrospirota bacterium]
MDPTRICILCGADTLSDIRYSDDIAGITSDCKLWPYSGRYARCTTCGHVQKRLSGRLINDIENIYSNYEPYSLSNGDEHLIFHESANITRSYALLKRLKLAIKNIPQEGRLIDIGCGNGSFLKAFGDACPKWDLFGFEQSNLRAKGVAAVKEIYCGSLDTIEGTYDIVTMIHVLEHVFEPVNFLRGLHTLINPAGVLFIQTPFFKTNPFDLTIVDHCSHFQPDTLAYAVNAAGFSTTLQEDWIAKEIGIVAGEGGSNQIPAAYAAVTTSVEQSFLWLHKVAAHARELSGQGTFGIFGTAIAGTWLASMAMPQVNFFTDEDPQKQGKEHLGLPVFHPQSVPYKDAVVYLAFPAETSIAIYKRLSVSYPQIKFCVPPALNAAGDCV